MFKTIFKENLVDFLKVIEKQFKFNIGGKQPSEIILSIPVEKIIKDWDSQIREYYQDCALENEGFLEHLDHKIMEILGIHEKILFLKKSKSEEDKKILSSIWLHINQLNFYSTASIILDDNPLIEDYKKKIEDDAKNENMFIYIARNATKTSLKLNSTLNEKSEYIKNILYSLQYIFSHLDEKSFCKDESTLQFYTLLKSQFLNRISQMNPPNFDMEAEVEKTKENLKKKMERGEKIVIGEDESDDSDSDSDSDSDTDSDSDEEDEKITNKNKKKQNKKKKYNDSDDSEEDDDDYETSTEE